jgi:hypothetical protein
MRKTMMARPAERKPQREVRAKKTVAASRKSEPIIQVVERQVPLRQTPNVHKKSGSLPTPLATFYF